MADKHPYVQSPGHLMQVVKHLRKSFPSTIDAGTLKKLGIAPKNESYLLNTLRFLGFIDDKGSKTDVAGNVFSVHGDTEFQTEFGKSVNAAYKELFNLHADETWKLDTNRLVTFFRESDQSSAIVGKRQANTFLALRALAGHSDLPAVNNAAPKATQVKEPKLMQHVGHPKPKTPKGAHPSDGSSTKSSKSDAGVALTVRIEVNLPASGDQATYDRIFKSIRENLLNA